MSDDALEAPKWDDAVSASPGKFRAVEPVEEELTNAFADTTIEDKDDEEQNEEQQPPATPEKDDKKDTSDLLSDLTKDADKGFISDSIVSPSKNEALFKGGSTNVLITTEDTEESSHDDPSKAGITSPTKLRRQNVYRAPRLRRVPLKPHAEPVSEVPLKEESSTAADPLGPLGASTNMEYSNEVSSASQGEDVLKLSEAPLFNINRTPLSPLKKPDSASSSTSNTSSVKSKQGPQAEIEAAKQRMKDKKNPTVKMEISVGDPIKVGELTGAHIAYSVRTQTDSDKFKSPQSVVSRRYRDFRWIYRQLQTTHPGRIIPPPPDKQAVGRFKEDFIESRRFALERMLVKISENPILREDPDFVMFLQSERFSSEAREREKAAATTSIFTEHDSDSLNSNSGNGGTGIFGSLGGAFSFTPKIMEPDEYFREKKVYIDSLDQQFKLFLKNLETIVMQRHDLSAVTEEFSNIVLTLADLEVSKSTTEIFQEFSTTQQRIKELLDRLSLQDMLTLGATLDEYQRVIGSVKTTFEQRDKLLVHLANCESELRKKQGSLDKYIKYNKTQTEKIEVIKTELTHLEQKQRQAREKLDTVSETIKEELANFEVEKIHDFRNSIEIYLESSIESQKEAVELWETFYNVTLSSA